MTWLLALARTVPGRSWAIAGALAGVLILVTFCSHRAVVEERARIEAANQAAARAAEARRNAAAERSADERLADTLTSSARERERHDATASLPDTRPSDRRIARACVQLRQQRTPERDLPAACRSGG